MVKLLATLYYLEGLVQKVAVLVSIPVLVASLEMAAATAGLATMEE
jgi:hypothetical protein